MPTHLFWNLHFQDHVEERWWFESLPSTKTEEQDTWRISTREKHL